ncbi:hypothetical protein QSJ18_02955 [Gordonia sp. ABSL1-1]|uniref:hypothetical protein n=1 Tax=Gordonia sp. ABSL1-1 TaxID=3053923 RepID=UPI0025726923|nr:hypothetical protein [Gordonia sp. ABSL1-1]MDL9935695.1 hypothetical protein [Gordonia sp. ABSL1-1]
MITGVERVRDGVATNGSRRRAVRLGLVGAVGALFAALLSAPVAQAIPEYTEPNLVTTLNCGSANPLGNGPLPVRVDVYNQIAFPSDGLPGPAISLIGYSLTRPQALEYTIEVRVNWRNQRTGRTGSVTVPSRAQSVRWQVDLHPGSGPVAFTIHQKVGLMLFVPMVNPQYSTCRGRAVA